MINDISHDFENLLVISRLAIKVIDQLVDHKYI